MDRTCGQYRTSGQSGGMKASITGVRTRQDRLLTERPGFGILTVRTVYIPIGGGSMAGELPRIYGIVERWLANAPDREALRFGDEAWSWRQLDGRIRRAAGALRASGVQAGDRIAVVDKNHPACLELTLAGSLLGA